MNKIKDLKVETENIFYVEKAFLPAQRALSAQRLDHCVWRIECSLSTPVWVSSCLGVVCVYTAVIGLGWFRFFLEDFFLGRFFLGVFSWSFFLMFLEFFLGSFSWVSPSYIRGGKDGGCRAVFAGSVLSEKFESFFSPVQTFVCCVCPFVDEAPFVQVPDDIVFF